MRKKKQDPIILIVYGSIVLLGLYFAAALGTAMDLSLNEDGSLNFNILVSSLETTMMDTKTVFAHLFTPNSKAPALTFIVAFAIGIYAILKLTSKKRLHRKGVEHGSARWATEKEEKALADSTEKIKPFEFFTDSDGKKQRVNFRIIGGKTGTRFTVTYQKVSKTYNIYAENNVDKLCADYKIPRKTAENIAIKARKSVKKQFETDNNILLTQEVRMSLNTRQHRENLNVLVIGGSGSGKSRFFVKPNLMQLNTSYVVTDPKGELLRSCGRLMEKAGYEIRVFNLIDMSHSHNYNPFNYVYKRDNEGNVIEVNKNYVMKMINCLMKNTKQEGATGGDQFWEDGTKQILLAVSFYLLERHQLEENGEEFHDPEGSLSSYSINFATVMRIMKLAEISEQDENHRSPLDTMMDELFEKNPQSMAASFYRDFKQAPAETAKSILISASVRFAAFNLPEVADLTHIDNIHLDTLGDRKTALFVIIPSSDATFNFLAAMMYSQLFDSLYDTANFKYGGRLPVHVRCLLDEFANIGTIPDFDKLLATMRSMEISANIIIQNLAQLKKMYDKSWEIVTGNCDSLLFLGGQEASTLEAISKSLDKETIDVVSQNRTRSRKSPSTSENNSIMGRELMTPGELKVMKPNECVLIIRAYYPFFCHKYDIEKHPNYVYLEDSNRKYAYLIDDLHTKRMAEDKEMYFETVIVQSIEKELIEEEEDEMQADWNIPEDEFDEEDIFDPGDEIYEPDEEITASQKLFTMDDDFEDTDEEIDPDSISIFDMSEPEVIDETAIKAMDLF